MVHTALGIIISASISFLSTSLIANDVQERKSLSLKATCNVQRCIEMTLNWGHNPPKFHAAEEDETRHTIFSFQVKGKLNGKATSMYDIRYTGYTAGLSCTDFGQGTVGVLGFRAGRPIVATSDGPLEVVDGSLTVGCPGCIRLMNLKTNEVVARYTSPSWDLTLSGISLDHVHERFSYDSDGDVFFKRDDDLCLRLNDDGFLSTSDPTACKVVQDVSAETLDGKSLPDNPNQFILRQDNMDDVLLIGYGACT